MSNPKNNTKYVQHGSVLTRLLRRRSIRSSDGSDEIVNEVTRNPNYAKNGPRGLRSGSRGPSIANNHSQKTYVINHSITELSAENPTILRKRVRAKSLPNLTDIGTEPRRTRFHGKQDCPFSLRRLKSNPQLYQSHVCALTSSVPQKSTSQPSTSQYLASRPSVPQYLASRPSVPQYLASRPSVPQYLASRPSVPQYLASRPSVTQYLASRPSVPQQFVSRPSVPQQFVSRPSVPQQFVSRPSVPQQFVSRPSVPVRKIPTTRYSIGQSFASNYLVTNRSKLNYSKSIAPSKTSFPQPLVNGTSYAEFPVSLYGQPSMTQTSFSQPPVSHLYDQRQMSQTSYVQPPMSRTSYAKPRQQSLAHYSVVPQYPVEKHLISTPSLPVLIIDENDFPAASVLSKSLPEYLDKIPPLAGNEDLKSSTRDTIWNQTKSLSIQIPPLPFYEGGSTYVDPPKWTKSKSIVIPSSKPISRPRLNTIAKLLPPRRPKLFDSGQSKREAAPKFTERSVSMPFLTVVT